MKTVLYAHTGSGNHGCEALVRTTTKLLDCKPVLFTTGYEEDIYWNVDSIANIFEDINRPISRQSVAYFVAAVQAKLTGKTTLFTKFSKKSTLDQVENGDLCLSIGGDNYCYAGTEILGNLNTLFRKKGAKTVLWGCSIDPEAITPQIIKDLKRYDLITVRESLTQATLAQVGISSNVRRVADPAFILDCHSIALPEGFLPGNTIGLNLSPLIFQYTTQQEEVLSASYALVEHLLHTTDSTVALIPHVVKDGNNDLEVLEPIFKRFQNTKRVILIPDLNCMELKYVISQCRLFIGSRTHATIAAYSSCVPTLVVGYSIKSRGIATDLFGTDEHYVLPVQKIHTDKDLIAAYSWLESNARQIKWQLQQVLPSYIEKALLGKSYLNELFRK